MKNKPSRLFAGVDLGGTTISTVLVNESGIVLSRTKCLTESILGVDAVVERIVHSVREVCHLYNINDKNLDGIGIGSPGPLSTKTGIIIDAPNLNGWVNVPLRDKVQASFTSKVYLDNDANAAAFGEYWKGAGQGFQNIIVITLGTGVGGGLIFDGKLLRGPDDNAGELGHMPVFPEGPACNCGGKGCLELYASATGLVNRAKHSLKAGTPSKVMDLCQGDIDKITSKMLHEACLLGDSFAIEVFRETGYYIGITAAGLVNLLNPELIILFGGVIGAGDFLFNPVREEIDRRAYPISAQRVKLVPAILGNDAGAIGAAGIAYQEFFPDEFSL